VRAVSAPDDDCGLRRDLLACVAALLLAYCGGLVLLAVALARHFSR
jgi:hypothetical protein